LYTKFMIYLVTRRLCNQMYRRSRCYILVNLVVKQNSYRILYAHGIRAEIRLNSIRLAASSKPPSFLLFRQRDTGRPLIYADSGRSRRSQNRINRTPASSVGDRRRGRGRGLEKREKELFIGMRVLIRVIASERLRSPAAFRARTCPKVSNIHPPPPPLPRRCGIFIFVNRIHVRQFDPIGIANASMYAPTERPSICTCPFASFVPGEFLSLSLSLSLYFSFSLFPFVISPEFQFEGYFPGDERRRAGSPFVADVRSSHPSR